MIASCRLVLLASVAALGLPAQALAQQVPDAGLIQRQQQETLEKALKEREAQQPRDREPVIRDEQPRPAASAAGDVAIEVSRFEVNPSEVLDNAAVRAAVAPFEGKRTTISGLFEALKAINDLYAAKGCITCRAILPPQDVQGGVVTIKLVEGRVGAFKVEGARYIRQGYLTSRLGLPAGSLFDYNLLQQQLVRFNDANDAQASATLRPGAATGEVDVLVAIKEPRRIFWSIAGDNAGRYETGRERVAATLGSRALFGASDPLVLSVIASGGSLSGAGSYSVPLNAHDTRLILAVDGGSIDIEKGQFATLDVGGSSLNVTASLEQPLYRSVEHKIVALASVARRRSDTDFGGVTVARNRGWSFAGGVQTRSYLPWGTLLSRVMVTHGVFDTINVDNDTFSKINGEVSAQAPLARGLSLVLRAEGQWTDKNVLPSFEQYQVGGTFSVRGFAEGMRAGERGYLTSAELRADLMPPTPEGRRPLQGFVFVDHGVAWPGVRAQDATDRLTGVGAGIAFALNETFSGRLVLAAPLSNRSASDMRDVRVHFSVIAAHF